MKLIIAIVQPDKLDAVRESLLAAGVVRISVSRITGHGQQEDEELYRGQVVVPNLIPKVRLEVAVNDDFVDKACDAIVTAAKHADGKIGDGKIFVLPLEKVVRIRTGETGSKAI